MRMSAMIDNDVYYVQRSDSGKECCGWLVMPAMGKAENDSTCAEFVTIALKHTSVKEQVTLLQSFVTNLILHHSL